MPFEPTQQVKEFSEETSLRLHLEKILARLAELTPSPDAPYVTVTLDWRPEGSDPSRRPGHMWYDQEARECLLDGRKAHEPDYESISADIDRIKNYLDNEAPAEAQGLIIVACNAKGIFVPLPVGVPLENRMLTGPIPALSHIGRIVDDFVTYAVLMVDQHDAILTFITQSRPEGGLNMRADDYPRKSKVGGFSQLRFQHRAEERMQAFAKDVVEEVQRALDDHGVDLLVLACEDEMAAALNAEFHETVKNRIVGHIHLDIRSGEKEVLEATIPVVAEAEREQERKAIQIVQDSLGPGGLAVSSAEDVIAALQGGQVMTLVMNDDFHGPGWADFTYPVYGVGEPPREHPIGGDPKNLVEVALEDEIVRLAVQSGAELEIVHSDILDPTEEGAPVRKAGETMPRAKAAAQLDNLGGVAAQLRFRLDENQSTANM